MPLGADGKLPELRLKETVEDQQTVSESRSWNPLILLAAVCLSLSLSVVLILMDVSPQSASLQESKQKARQIIDAEYTANVGNKELESYQIYLREALMAYQQGNYRKERQYYQKVLDMLRAERVDSKRGLTGSPKRDRELEKQLNILLSDAH